MKDLNIKIILGSTRDGRFGSKPANWVFEYLKAQEGLSVELVDLREHKLPFFEDGITPYSLKGKYTNEDVKKWAHKIKEADGFIFVCPEYNHSIPAVLKNSLDYIYYEWNNKPMAIVSYGTVGGARGIEHLRGIAIELQMAPIRASVHIFKPWLLLDEKGELKNDALDEYNTSRDHMVEQLLWWAKALKVARDN